MQIINNAVAMSTRLAPDVFSERSTMTRVWIMRCMMIKRVRLNGREAWDGVTGT